MGERVLITNSTVKRVPVALDFSDLVSQSKRPMMEQGFNSDVVFQGTSYHVQTEDWGEANPYVVTRVFSSGSVVKSLKTTYGEIEKSNPSVGRQAIRLGMRDQHQKVLDQLVSGALLTDIIK